MQLVKDLTASDLVRLADAPVLKAKQYAREVTAHKVLEAARAEAKTIVANARAERRRIFDAARAEAQAEMQRVTIQRTQAMAEQLDGWVEAVKPQLLDAVMAAVRKLVEAEPSTRRVQTALSQALSDVASARRLTLRLHPSQIRAFNKARTGLRTKSGFRGEILLKPDAQLQPGDCVVETPLGVLDLRLETQLQTLKADMPGAP
ncbi:MAG: type III secretion system stator protein SctL [Hyphomicrobiales bacterium]|nr:type III secretion system stator protein SctL [Hyphomicrobiales bacterium]